MPLYMLLMYNPAGYAPSQEEMAELHPRWQQFAKDLHDEGAFVSNHGLRGAESATTVRVRDGETLITDGPFAETKELLAGYFVIEAPDLDGAIAWSLRMPNIGFGSVEVRPVWG